MPTPFIKFFVVKQNETKRVIYPMQGSLATGTRSNVVRAGVWQETERKRSESEEEKERGEGKERMVATGSQRSLLNA